MKGKQGHVLGSNQCVRLKEGDDSTEVVSILCRRDEIILVISASGWHCKRCCRSSEFSSEDSIESHLRSFHNINTKANSCSRFEVESDGVKKSQEVEAISNTQSKLPEKNAKKQQIFSFPANSAVNIHSSLDRPRKRTNKDACDANTAVDVNSKKLKKSDVSVPINVSVFSIPVCEQVISSTRVELQKALSNKQPLLILPKLDTQSFLQNKITFGSKKSKVHRIKKKMTQADKKLPHLPRISNKRKSKYTDGVSELLVKYVDKISAETIEYPESIDHELKSNSHSGESAIDGKKIKTLTNASKFSFSGCEMEKTESLPQGKDGSVLQLQLAIEPEATALCMTKTDSFEDIESEIESGSHSSMLAQNGNEIKSITDTFKSSPAGSEMNKEELMISSQEIVVSLHDRAGHDSQSNLASKAHTGCVVKSPKLKEFATVKHFLENSGIVQPVTQCPDLSYAVKSKRKSASLDVIIQPSELVPFQLKKHVIDAPSNVLISSLAQNSSTSSSYMDKTGSLVSSTDLSNKTPVTIPIQFQQSVEEKEIVILLNPIQLKDDSGAIIINTSNALFSDTVASNAAVDEVEQVVTSEADTGIPSDVDTMTISVMQASKNNSDMEHKGQISAQTEIATEELINSCASIVMSGKEDPVKVKTEKSAAVSQTNDVIIDDNSLGRHINEKGNDNSEQEMDSKKKDDSTHDTTVHIAVEKKVSKRFCKRHYAKLPLPCECKFCLHPFTDTKSLQAHVRRYEGQQPVQCKICQQKFHNLDLLNIHVFNNHDRTVSPLCLTCMKCFRNRTTLLKHIASHHPTSAGLTAAQLSLDSLPMEKCSVCDMHIISDPEIVELHYEAHSKADFSCRVCGITFKRRFLLFAHIRLEHNQDNEGRNLSCELDQEMLGKVTSLLQEEQTRNKIGWDPAEPGPSQSFYCKTCNLELMDSCREILKHVMKHYKPASHEQQIIFAQYHCPDCGKEIRDVGQNVDFHRLTHGHIDSKNINLKCGICTAYFTTESRARIHEVQVHKMEEQTSDTDKKIMCEICGKEYKQLRGLAYHMKTHKEDKGFFTCDICKRGFAFKHHLEMHQARHKSQSVSCPYCGKTYLTKSAFERHVQVVHDGVKDNKLYKCDRCSAQFNKSTLMADHIATKHEGKRPHTCHLCPQTFVCRTTMKRHLRRDHEGLNPYICKICGEQFTDKKYLVRHEFLHSGAEPYVCCYCQKVLASEQSLKVHEDMHRGVRSFMCEDCGMGYSKYSNLKKHRSKSCSINKHGSNRYKVSTCSV